jgi:hypothetical protein
LKGRRSNGSWLMQVGRRLSLSDRTTVNVGEELGGRERDSTAGRISLSHIKTRFSVGVVHDSN